MKKPDVKTKVVTAEQGYIGFNREDWTSSPVIAWRIDVSYDEVAEFFPHDVVAVTLTDVQADWILARDGKVYELNGGRVYEDYERFEAAEKNR